MIEAATMLCPDAEASARLGRRHLLLALPAALACLAPNTAGAGPIENYRDFRGPLPRLHRRGIISPIGTEQGKADAILAAAPRSSPLAIMEYFEGLTATNRNGEAFNAGWRTHWNPVIVAFFHATDTAPSGDKTSWCAAFLNWCLDRADYRGGTDSANSGTFRTVPGRTSHPHPGDIVVFGDTNPVRYREGLGHVGLFLDRRGNSILVLGGNQKNRFGHQAVCRKWLGIHDTKYDLNLHSFHRIGALE